MQRLEILAKGREGQKIPTARLFVGLLAEQNAMANSEPLYRYAAAPKQVLRDAVRVSLSDANWKVKLETLSSLLVFPELMDYELIGAVSENLGDEYWPVRMAALYLLSTSQENVSPGFKQVLDWTAGYDSQQSVRDMAVAFGGQAAKPEEEIDGEIAE